jgi:hypothetical protein
MSIKIKKKRDYRPHWEVLHGARVLLHLSAEQPKGCYYQWMGSLLLSAFAFEGYLNFLGKVFFPSWESSERRSSWRRKVKKIEDRLGFLVDEGREPFLTVNLLFQFRNQVAHPKPREFTEEYVTSPEKMEALPLAMYENAKSDEEKYCSEANAKLCIERVEEMMELLYKHARIKFEAENPYNKDFILYAPFVPSGQSGSAHYD